MEPIYLDNASTSFPKPPQVAQAMFDYVTGCGCNIGRGGYEGAYQAPASSCAACSTGRTADAWRSPRTSPKA